MLVPRLAGAPRNAWVATWAASPQAAAPDPDEPLLNKAASHVPLPIPGLVMSGVNMVRFGRNITLGPGFTFAIIEVESLKGPIC